MLHSLSSDLKRKTSFELLLKLGEVFGCSVDDLINSKKIPATESDGDLVLDLSKLDEDQIKLIRKITKISPQQVSALLSVAETYLTEE